MICQHILFLLSLSSVIHFLWMLPPIKCTWSGLCYSNPSVRSKISLIQLSSTSFSDSPIHSPHSMLFTLKSVRLMEFVSEGLSPFSPIPLLTYLHLATPPSQPNMPMKKYQPFPPSVTCAAVVQARTAFEGRVSDSWGSLSGKKPCRLLALYLGPYFTSRVAHLFL